METSSWYTAFVVSVCVFFFCF
uniref:Uncharacterized protein n=1 Tax=Anguilla anguilla TaxID=7936 RepID=A0A0E9S0W6_ANGAN